MTASFCPIRINISQHGLGPQAKARNGQLPASGFDHEDLIPIMIFFVFQVGRPEEDLWEGGWGIEGECHESESVLGEAGYPMALPHFHEIRFMNTAHRFCRGASRMKATSRWRIDSTGDFPPRHGLGPPILGVWDRHCGQKCRRVGMNWALENLF